MQSCSGCLRRLGRIHSAATPNAVKQASAREQPQPRPDGNQPCRNRPFASYRPRRDVERAVALRPAHLNTSADAGPNACSPRRTSASTSTRLGHADLIGAAGRQTLASPSTRSAPTPATAANARTTSTTGSSATTSASAPARTASSPSAPNSGFLRRWKVNAPPTTSPRPEPRRPSAATMS